jgi:signal recognition particle GTPase
MVMEILKVVLQFRYRPILYVGTGQGYDDLQSFDSDEFTEKLEEGT